MEAIAGVKPIVCVALGSVRGSYCAPQDGLMGNRACFARLGKRQHCLYLFFVARAIVANIFVCGVQFDEIEEERSPDAVGMPHIEFVDLDSCVQRFVMITVKYQCYFYFDERYDALVSYWIHNSLLPRVRMRDIIMIIACSQRPGLPRVSHSGKIARRAHRACASHLRAHVCIQV